MAWTTNDTVMKFRERYHVVDVVVETLDGWRRHQSSKDAWLLAFFTFLSIFPLLLAGVTILAIVLEDNEDLRQRIVNGAMSEIPVLGKDLQSPEAISGGVWSIVLGLGGALWSSGKAFVGLQTALDDTWDLPLDGRAGMPAQRGKALLGVAIIGASQVGSLAIASIIGAAELPAVSDIALVGATVAINIGVIAAMYRFLTSYETTWSDVWPGAIVAGIVFTALQHFGRLLVQRFAGVDSASDGAGTLQTIGVIIGLITWLSFIGITVMMCAELNAALKRLRTTTHAERSPDMAIAIRN